MSTIPFISLKPISDCELLQTCKLERRSKFVIAIQTCKRDNTTVIHNLQKNWIILLLLY